MTARAQPTLDEIDFRLRDALSRRQLSGWRLGFARSFVGLCKRGGTPSAKQEYCARRIVAELRNPGPDVDLIDDSGDADELAHSRS